MFSYDRPYRSTNHSATETILTLETSVWKPGLIVLIAWQKICDRDDPFARDDYMETMPKRVLTSDGIALHAIKVASGA